MSICIKIIVFSVVIYFILHTYNIHRAKTQKELDSNREKLQNDLDSLRNLHDATAKELKSTKELQAQLNRDIVKYKPLHEFIGDKEITDYENAGIIDRSIT